MRGLERGGGEKGEGGGGEEVWQIKTILASLELLANGCMASHAIIIHINDRLQIGNYKY